MTDPTLSFRKVPWKDLLYCGVCSVHVPYKDLLYCGVCSVHVPYKGVTVSLGSGLMGIKVKRGIHVGVNNKTGYMDK